MTPEEIVAWYARWGVTDKSEIATSGSTVDMLAAEIRAAVEAERERFTKERDDLCSWCSAGMIPKLDDEGDVAHGDYPCKADWYWAALGIFEEGEK